MLIDHRTYHRPCPAACRRSSSSIGKLGYPIQLRYMGEPLFYLAAESGELNTLVHGWVYESAADREAKRARMGQDPGLESHISPRTPRPATSSRSAPR